MDWAFVAWGTAFLSTRPYSTHTHTQNNSPFKSSIGISWSSSSAQLPRRIPSETAANFSPTMFRPQSAQTRNENALRNKSLRQLAVTSDPVERLRLMCLSRGSNGIIGLSRVFRRMDDDGSKHLNFEEFHKGIEEFGLRDLEVDEMQELFSLFDKDGSGSINYDEFLKTIRPPMTSNRQKLVMEAYAKLDRTGDGQVTIEDLKNVYSVRHHPQFLNGEMTEDQLLTKFLANFEKNSDADGTVTKEEFLDYYSGVSASIDTDAYFDLMMRNAWKL